MTKPKKVAHAYSENYGCEVSRKSPSSLYSLNIASFTMGVGYDQKDAKGFVNLIGLPMRVRAHAGQRAK